MCSKPQKKMKQKITNKMKVVYFNFFLFFLFVSVGAVANVVEVDFQPAVINLQVGEKALVQVVVADVPGPGLQAFQLSINFDAGSVNLNNPNAGTPLGVFEPLGGNAFCSFVTLRDACSDPIWFLTSTGRMAQLASAAIDNGRGIGQIAFGSAGIQPAPAGSGAIAIIEVEGIAPGSVQVNLSEVVLSSPDLQAYPVMLGNLTITVGSVNDAPIAVDDMHRGRHGTDP